MESDLRRFYLKKLYLFCFVDSFDQFHGKSQRKILCVNNTYSYKPDCPSPQKTMEDVMCMHVLLESHLEHTETDDGTTAHSYLQVHGL